MNESKKKKSKVNFGSTAVQTLVNGISTRVKHQVNARFKRNQNGSGPGRRREAHAWVGCRVQSGYGTGRVTRSKTRRSSEVFNLKTTSFDTSYKTLFYFFSFLLLSPQTSLSLDDFFPSLHHLFFRATVWVHMNPNFGGPLPSTTSSEAKKPNRDHQ